VNVACVIATGVNLKGTPRGVGCECVLRRGEFSAVNEHTPGRFIALGTSRTTAPRMPASRSGSSLGACRSTIPE